jgi:hypothetical protein
MTSTWRDIGLCSKVCAAFVFLVAGGSGQGQESKPVTGVWKVTVEQPDGNPKEQILFLHQDGDKILAKVSGFKNIGKGTISDRKLKVKFAIGMDSNEGPTLTGEVAEGKLSGKISIGDGEMKLKGLLVVAVWLCSNHDPEHAATSEAEIRKLTDEHSCERWHKLGSEEAVRKAFKR